jgi:hypothetical protein
LISDLYHIPTTTNNHICKTNEHMGCRELAHYIIPCSLVQFNLSTYSWLSCMGTYRYIIHGFRLYDPNATNAKFLRPRQLQITRNSPFQWKLHKYVIPRWIYTTPTSPTNPPRFHVATSIRQFLKFNVGSWWSRFDVGSWWSRFDVGWGLN